MPSSAQSPHRAWSRDDLRIIRALQVAPRASFARIGEVLGLHERTVSRRYAALRREGVLRIHGVVNPLAVGHDLWQVRVRCRPDAAEPLATALAGRDDIAWVGITAAGSEVSFSIRSLSQERRDLLLTRSLPRTAHVLDIDAHVVLRVFLGMSAHDWSGLADRLSAEETAALGGVTALRGTRRAMELAPYDAAIFAALAADGRAGHAALATAAGISDARAARRLGALLEHQVVVIDLDLATAAFGYHVGARLHLQVAPARLNQVGQALAELPEIGFVGALSGRDNLMASATCRDLSHLYELSSGSVGTIEGITAMEVVPIMRVVKQSGARMVDGRLLG
ncbi:MAG: Lrp/AsnC family transcriptional regulator [Nocardioides sp.]|uniref:Lrp/AsnC family transcriptional regulator n=1 Tax=Nocardioides sp. TaxID=35761 RepID=UPI0039E32427